jgi:Ca2+-binding EF-hand superfamily protein
MTSIGPRAAHHFRSIDANQDGQLQRVEVAKHFRDKGAENVQGATDRFMNRSDANGDGKVGLREFERGRPPQGVQDRAERLMKRADANGDGTLSKEEMTAAIQKRLEARGVENAAEKAEAIATHSMQRIDANKDGQIQSVEGQRLAGDLARTLSAIPRRP